MTNRRDVVVIGASAGGVEALRTLIAGLPPDFPAAVLIVLHVPPTGRSALPMILARSGPLSATQARPDDPIRQGHVLVAPPDHHMIVYDGRVTLSRGPTENGHRPAVDVLFRTAARALGPRVIGVILSGALDDGAAGMLTIRSRGGAAVVQEPDDALQPGMPKAAIFAAQPELILPVAKIPTALMELAQEEVSLGDTSHSSRLLEKEAAVAHFDMNELNDLNRPGTPSGLSCPDCRGALFEIHEGDLIRYRCRVGHAWSQASLLAQQSSSMESALWMALRSLEEKAALTLEMGDRAREQGHTLTAGVFQAQCEEAQRAAGMVRDLIDRISGGDIADEVVMTTDM